MNETEIKLNRGWRLTKYASSVSKFLVCDTNLNMFIHAEEIQLSNNSTCKKAWLNLKVNDKQIGSIWLTTQAAIKRVEDLLKEE